MDDGRTADILLVEDNPADVDLTKESLEEARILCNLHVAWDGVEALKFLKCEPPYEDAPRPDLVLLDLNLPKVDGREVLRECREDESLTTLPVVVLTSSEAETDVAKAYEMRANAYVVKPVGLEEFVEIMDGIGNFFLRIVTLPH